MMNTVNLRNINMTLREPDSSYTFESVRAEGAFLVITYRKYVFTEIVDGKNELKGTERVIIWLNDQGREVVRTENNFEPIPVPAVIPEPAPEKNFWQTLKEDLIVLKQGLLPFGG